MGKSGGSNPCGGGFGVFGSRAVLVFSGACQGTAWAGLRLIHHHRIQAAGNQFGCAIESNRAAFAAARRPASRGPLVFAGRRGAGGHRRPCRRPDGPRTTLHRALRRFFATGKTKPRRRHRRCLSCPFFRAPFGSCTRQEGTSARPRLSHAEPGAAFNEHNEPRCGVGCPICALPRARAPGDTPPAAPVRRQPPRRARPSARHVRAPAGCTIVGLDSQRAVHRAHGERCRRTGAYARLPRRPNRTARAAPPLRGTIAHARGAGELRSVAAPARQVTRTAALPCACSSTAAAAGSGARAEAPPRTAGLARSFRCRLHAHHRARLIIHTSSTCVRHRRRRSRHRSRHRGARGATNHRRRHSRCIATASLLVRKHCTFYPPIDTSPTPEPRHACRAERVREEPSLGGHVTFLGDTSLPPLDTSPPPEDTPHPSEDTSHPSSEPKASHERDADPSAFRILPPGSSVPRRWHGGCHGRQACICIL